LPSSALATHNGPDPAVVFTSFGKSLEEAGKSLEKLIATTFQVRRSGCTSHRTLNPAQGLERDRNGGELESTRAEDPFSLGKE